MAKNLEWRGTYSTAWNTAGNWYDLDASGDSTTVPTSADTLTVSASPTNLTINVITTGGVGKSLDLTGAGTNYLTLSGSATLIISGSVTLQSGMSWTHTGGLWVGYGTTGNLTTNSVSLVSEQVNGLRAAAGSTISLQDTLTCYQLFMYGTGAGGTLVTNNNTINCNLFGDGGLGGTVTLTLGSSTINCTNVSFGTCTLTVSDNTATINVTSTADITSALGGVAWGTGGDTSFVYVMTGGKKLSLSGANTIGNFTISWLTNNIESGIVFNSDQTISGTLTITGSSVIARPRVYSSSFTTNRTITAGTVTITGALDFYRITGAGGSWDLSGIASGDLGQNSNITLRSPTNYYLTTLTANRVSTDNVYSLADDGTADGTAVFPLPQDTIIVNNNTGDNSNKTFTYGGYWHRTAGIDASACTEALTIAFYAGSSCTYYGNIILTGSGITITSTGATVAVSAHTVSPLSINCGSAIGAGAVVVSSYTGTVQLLTNNLTHTGTFTLSVGIFDLNGLTLTTASFSSSNTSTRVLQDTPTGGKVVITGVTGTPFTIDTTTGLTVSNAPDIQIGTSTETLTGDCTLAFGSKPCTFGDLTFKKYAGNFKRIVTGIGNTFGAVTQETPDAV